MNLRIRLSRFLSRFIDIPAAAMRAAPDFTIRDGVNYELPIVMPDDVPADEREKLLQEVRDYYHSQFDTPYIAGAPFRMVTTDPLREWDWPTRRSVLSSCHMAWERNPLAKGAVKLIRLFVMGEGLSITYRNERVKEIIEGFRSNPDNGVESLEKELCDTLIIDGEIFVRFFADDEGQVVITPLPAFEIDWIETEPGFFKRPRVYHQIGTQYSGRPGDAVFVDEEIQAADVLHIAINKLAYEVRGRPDLFVILPWLKAYKQWLENRARQNYWRGAVLWWLKLIGGSPTQVASARAQFKQPPPPGSILVTNDKEELKDVGGHVGASDSAEDGRQMKLMNAVGMLLPEYMLSDGENANLASAKSQQLPALRSFTDYQDIVVAQIWKPIYRRVVEKAIAAGILSEEIEEQDEDGDPIRDAEGATKTIRAMDAFDVSAPELESDDPKTLAEALQIAVNRGWISNETATGEMGFDYAMEQKKIEREEQAAVTAAAQGRSMIPTTQPGLPEQPIPSQTQQEGEMTRQDFELILQTMQTALATRPASQQFSMTIKEAEVTLPEQQPPIIQFEPQIVVNVPEQSPPVVNVNVPAQPEPRVVVRIPTQPPSPVTVNVPPDAIQLEMPDETIRVTERDNDGRVKTIKKSRN